MADSRRAGDAPDALYCVIGGSLGTFASAESGARRLVMQRTFAIVPHDGSDGATVFAGYKYAQVRLRDWK